MTNYIKLKPGLFYQNYVFFDVEQYYADNLFIQHKIKVTFLREYQKEDIWKRKCAKNLPILTIMMMTLIPIAVLILN